MYKNKLLLVNPITSTVWTKDEKRVVRRCAAMSKKYGMNNVINGEVKSVVW